MKTSLLSIRTGLAGILALVLLSVSAESIAQHPLDSWVRRTVPGPNSALSSIAFGNGTFVAVGDNSFVARSTDGITWTTSTAGAYGTLKRVRFLNGQFVAVGASDKIIYSSDGASWTANTLPRANFWDVTWGNGVYVLAGASTYVSSDGANWAQTHPIVVDPPSGPYEPSLDTVMFANGGFLAVPTVFGFRQAQSVFSTNGIDWIAGGASHRSTSSGGGELVYRDGVWLSTVQYDIDVGKNGVLVSTNNGVSWCCRFGSSEGGALASEQGYFLFFWNLDYAHVFVSTNGFSWGMRFYTNGPAIRSSAFGNGTFVAVGYNTIDNSSYVLQSGNIGGVTIIVQEPQDRVATVDDPVRFSVQAVGAPPLAYQWYHNGTAITDATNTSYTITHVTTGDIGGYHVVITNSINSVTSRVAQLTVAFLGIDLYAGIKILGVPGRTYQIEATPASGAPNWQTLTNLVLPSNPYIWIDYESPSVPARLYRAGELP